MLNETLKVNNLPETTIPNTPLTRKKLDMAAKDDEKMEVNKDQTDASDYNEDKTENPAHEEPEITPEYDIKGRDIGLAIITPVSQGEHEDNLSLRKLKEELKNRKYKWAYTDNIYEESEVYREDTPTIKTHEKTEF